RRFSSARIRSADPRPRSTLSFLEHAPGVQVVIADECRILAVGHNDSSRHAGCRLLQHQQSCTPPNRVIEWSRLWCARTSTSRLYRSPFRDDGSPCMEVVTNTSATAVPLLRGRIGS